MNRSLIFDRVHPKLDSQSPEDRFEWMEAIREKGLLMNRFDAKERWTDELKGTK